MLDVKDVSFRADEKKILDKVSFRVRPGGFLVVTGPNGSGKSSLAKIIMGLVKQTGGKILLNGEDISGLSMTERARKGISFSFQQPVRFKGLTVYDLLNIANGVMMSPEEAGEILAKVGLSASEYLEREVNGKLSGGELKRIEIATVLARDSEVLIFDEPEAGIDLWSFDDLVQVFRKLHKEGKTIVVISHQERILKIADEVLILEKGRVLEPSEAQKILPKIQEGKDEF